MLFGLNPLNHQSFVNSNANSGHINNLKVKTTKKDRDLFKRKEFKIIDFKTITRLQKFDRLSKIEKKQVQNVANRLYKDKNALLTLVDKKPSALVVVSERDFLSINRHNELLNSDKFTFVTQDVDSKLYSKSKRNIFVVNNAEFKKVLEENLDFFKYRLNNPELDTEKAFKILTDKDSPLFDIRNCHDLVGICLGFPHQDSLLFNLRRDIANMIKDAEVRNQKDTNAFKTLDLLYSILLPPNSNLQVEGSKGSNVNKILEDWNVKKPESNETNHTGGYALITWDKDSEEIRCIQNKLAKGFDEVNDKFNNAGDVLQLLLGS